MIASHDTYTYLPPRHCWMRPFTWLWRTQDLNIDDQKKAGVRYLDIRVRRDHGACRDLPAPLRSDKGVWRVCHGLVDFSHAYGTLTILDLMMRANGLRYRVILERGTPADERRFAEEISNIKYAHTGPLRTQPLRYAAIKKGWRIILTCGDPVADHSFTPFLSDNTLWQNLRRLLKFRTLSPRRWARKHSPLSYCAEAEADSRSASHRARDHARNDGKGLDRVSTKRENPTLHDLITDNTVHFIDFIPSRSANL